MSAEFSELFRPSNARTQPELMLAAVLHLVSHYTASDSGCVKLASVIARHFKALADRPDLTPVLRATCQQLAEQWSDVVERTLPRPARAGLLSAWRRPAATSLPRP